MDDEGGVESINLDNEVDAPLDFGILSSDMKLVVDFRFR